MLYCHNSCCSVAKLGQTLCNPMDCNTPGFSVLHRLLQLAQTHVHWVSDAIQPSHPLSSPPSPLPSIFPSIRIFSIESVLHIRWPKYWSFSFSISPWRREWQTTSVFLPWEPHEPQHTRPPCPSPPPAVYPNSCPLSQWCHPIISSSVVPFSSCPQSFPASGSFLMSQLFSSSGQSIGSLSFSISSSNEHSGLISFRTDWLDLLAVQGTLKSLLQHHSSKASILQHSAFFIV